MSTLALEVWSELAHFNSLQKQVVVTANLQQRFMIATMTALQCTGCSLASSLQWICGVLRSRVAP